MVELVDTLALGASAERCGGSSPSTGTKLERNMHFKTICKSCEKLMGQCRCPSENKEIRYDVCDSCKIEGEQVQAQLKRSLVAMIENDDFFIKNVNYTDLSPDGFPLEVNIQLLPRSIDSG